MSGEGGQQPAAGERQADLAPISLLEAIRNEAKTWEKLAPRYGVDNPDPPLEGQSLCDVRVSRRGRRSPCAGTAPRRGSTRRDRVRRDSRARTTAVGLGPHHAQPRAAERRGSRRTHEYRPIAGRGTLDRNRTDGKKNVAARDGKSSTRSVTETANSRQLAGLPRSRPHSAGWSATIR
jgi:hypothetical protein